MVLKAAPINPYSKLFQTTFFTGVQSHARKLSQNNQPDIYSEHLVFPLWMQASYHQKNKTTLSLCAGVFPDQKNPQPAKITLTNGTTNTPLSSSASTSIFPVKTEAALIFARGLSVVLKKNYLVRPDTQKLEVIEDLIQIILKKQHAVVLNQIILKRDLKTLCMAIRDPHVLKKLPYTLTPIFNQSDTPQILFYKLMNYPNPDVFNFGTTPLSQTKITPANGMSHTSTPTEKLQNQSRQQEKPTLQNLLDIDDSELSKWLREKSLCSAELMRLMDELYSSKEKSKWIIHCKEHRCITAIMIELAEQEHLKNLMKYLADFSWMDQTMRQYFSTSITESSLQSDLKIILCTLLTFPDQDLTQNQTLPLQSAKTLTLLISSMPLQWLDPQNDMHYKNLLFLARLFAQSGVNGITYDQEIKRLPLSKADDTDLFSDWMRHSVR